MVKKNRKQPPPSSQLRDKNQRPAALAPEFPLGSWKRIALCCALFLVVIGVRWWMIGRYGSDLPFWDQWNGEGTDLYKPYFDGTLSFKHWFAAHNEHRIFLTRLLSLGLLIANGQWDARLQMMVNAGLYALVPCGLLLVLTGGRNLRFSAVLWAGLALLFTLPFGWENTLAGFQSQFYFLTIFSLAALFLLLNSPAYSVPWLIGVLAGIAGLFSMASGLIAPAAVLGVILLSCGRNASNARAYPRQYAVTIIACCLIILAGFLLSVKVEFHVQKYQAHSFGQFVGALAQCLSWPWPSSWWFILTWLPGLFFIADYLRKKIEDGPIERFLLGVGCWVVLQNLAIAYSRSITVFSSRYTDLMSFGLLANALYAVWLIRARPRQTAIVAGFMAAWMIVNGIGLYRVSFNGAVTARKQIFEAERMRTAGYMLTRDFSFLSPVQLQEEIPYPDANFLAQTLNDPLIARLLPVSVQTSLPLTPAQGSPVPLFIEESRPALDVRMPEQWDRTGIFSRFAIIDPTTRFLYSFRKKTELPYVFLYFRGNKESLALVDARGGQHDAHILSTDKTGQWHNAVAACPTLECSISGRAGTSGLVLMEPKEMGRLSAAAFLAGRLGE